MSLIASTVVPLKETGAYEIANSCRFDNAWHATTDSMVRETGTPSDQTRWTLSCWVKMSNATFGNRKHGTLNIAGANTGTPERSSIQISSDQLIWIDYPYSTFGGHNLVTTRKFRDGSAWYHFVFVFNSNESTQADRAKIYINGVRETDFDTNSVSIDSAEDSPYWNHADYEHFHGRDAYGNGWSGYMAEIIFLDGTAGDADDFGESHEDTGIWIPKKYSGSFGNNGYHLDFESSGSMGADASGNSNDFTLTGVAAINQCTDSPTNNFCTLNNNWAQGTAIFYPEDGATRITVNSNHCLPGTMAVNKGKWYWETYTSTYTGVRGWWWGILPTDAKYGVSADPAGDAMSAWYSASNVFYEATSRSASTATANTGFSGYTNGDIYSISLNCDEDPYEMTIRLNNSIPGTTANNTDRSVGAHIGNIKYVFPAIRVAQQSATTWVNFGNPAIAALSGGNADENGYGNFKYAPPSGYYALCSKNLAEFA